MNTRLDTIATRQSKTRVRDAFFAACVALAAAVSIVDRHDRVARRVGAGRSALVLPSPVRMPGKVHVIDHPLVQHKLTLMRSKETSTSTFRNLLREISMLLAYEVCRDLPTTKIQIETPIAPTMAPMLDGKKIVLDLDPARRQRHPRRHARHPAVGARRPHRPVSRSEDARRRSSTTTRSPTTWATATRSSSIRCSRPATPRSPRSIASRRAARARSSSSACSPAPKASACSTPRTPTCRSTRPRSTSALNEKSYIVPGLGDAGDRLFGTK